MTSEIAAKVRLGCVQNVRFDCNDVYPGELLKQGWRE